jgi:leader peptidase (prepilin peptidase) / N-methyltransferase
MEYLIVFVFGAIIGSFLNVCIHRIPLGESIVFPGSHGIFCGEPIRWYDNIPLVSYLVLRGKCRNCSRPIPIRYFVVELVTALSAMCLLFFFSIGPRFFVYCFFVFALIVVTFIDIEHQEIPDVITLTGIPVGILAVTLFKLGSQATYSASFVDSVLGMVAGGGAMFLMGFFGEMIYRREALGGGDVKLMCMVGAFLGWKLVLLAFFLAPLFGAGVGVFMRIKFDKEVIPYGPYLAMGAVISLLFGEDILKYLFAI